MKLPACLRGGAVVVLVAAMSCLAPAHAEKADRDKPVNFSSDDAGGVNYETRTGSLKGNVVITQGTMTVRADRIDFKQNADNSLSATAFGNPISFRQKRDDSDGYDEGWALRAEYDGAKEQLELFDNAILKRGTDEIRSNYISYNSKTELFRAEGRPATTPVAGDAGRNDRVRGTFQPKENPAPGKAPAAKSNTPLSLTPSGELAPSKAK